GYLEFSSSHRNWIFNDYLDGHRLKHSKGDTSIPPPPPPKKGDRPQGHNWRSIDRQAVETSVKKLALSQEVFFRAGHYPLSEANRKIFTAYELKGGLPDDPQQWNFYSVARHVDDGLTLDEKALPKFKAEFQRLTIEKEAASKDQSALHAILRHSQGDFKRLNRFYARIIKHSAEKLEGSRPITATGIASNLENDVDASPPPNRDRGPPLPDISPISVTESFVDTTDLLDESSIFPSNLVFLKKDITRSFALSVASVIQSRLRAFLDTENLGVYPKLAVAQLATRLNELYRRYLARRESFYES
ncbi:hypothetical protein HDU67_004128, partial [Dinochytrium kinnereticum]